MSDFNLLDEMDKDSLEQLANVILSNTEFCEIYEDDDWSYESVEKQQQAFLYLRTQISASRDDK